MYKAWSGFPNDPEILFKATSFAHHLVSLIVEMSVLSVLTSLFPKVHPLIRFLNEYSSIIQEGEEGPTG